MLKGRLKDSELIDILTVAAAGVEASLYLSWLFWALFFIYLFIYIFDLWHKPVWLYLLIILWSCVFTFTCYEVVLK